MEEHPHKRLLALTIILVIAVIIGSVYYLSAQKKQKAPGNPRVSPEVQNALKTLQSNSAKVPAPAPLTPEQKKALESLGNPDGSAVPAPTQSKNSPSEEQSILDSLQK